MPATATKSRTKATPTRLAVLTTDERTRVEELEGKLGKLLEAGAALDVNASRAALRAAQDKFQETLEAGDLAEWVRLSRRDKSGTAEQERDEAAKLVQASARQLRAEIGRALAPALKRATEGCAKLREVAIEQARKEAEEERRPFSEPTGKLAMLQQCASFCERVRQKPEGLVPVTDIRRFVEDDLRIGFGE